ALHPDVRQPTVIVAANGAPIGQFRPSADWADYPLTIPAGARSADPLVLTLHASDTFTRTTTYPDIRPKGVRVAQISVRETGAWFTWPAPVPLLWLALDSALWMLTLAALTRRPTLAFVLTTLLVSGAAIGLALARGWAAALLPWAVLVPAVGLLYVRRAALMGLLGKLLHRYSRGGALNYGLVALAAAWLAYVVARAGLTLQPPGWRIFSDTFPDSLLLGLLGMGLLLLALVLGREGLPRLAHAIVRIAGSRHGALALFALFAAIWVGYEASIIAVLPYVGHADYADNAVVARNLVAGRGWVVDYVTQFYQLYPTVTHPQETWPLLQPVWIAPFFALFGAEAWAAKVPNLIFITMLGALIYAAGARLWDRRVGLTAAVVVLTSRFFFNLVIYTTSDLAFVLLSFGAIYLLYRAMTNDQRPTTNESRPSPTFVIRRSSLVGSALLTGLMLLQKPGSGVIIAGGMGLWLLAQVWRVARRPATDGKAWWSVVGARYIVPVRWSVVVWAPIALLILSPYLVRNLALFGTPFYTTESRDAWIIEYGDWEDIYKVYTAEGGLNAPDNLPNRNWVLRWGFDRTLLKLNHQAAAVRDYLAPPWDGLPLSLGDGLSGREDKSLLFGMGAWLGALGALGALRSRRRLITLLVAAFAPYTIFLLTYWHANEERYFVVLMPWLALLAGYALWRGYDRIAAIGDGRWTPVGLALAVTALVLVIAPSWPSIAKKVNVEPQILAADLDAYAWLGDHTATDAVVMTRLPWQLNWHSRHPALMIPNTDKPDVLLRLARYYNARYLVLDTAQRPSDQAQQVINDLLKDPRVGFKKVYATPPNQALD
ncbi:MAG TPA: glycosyltransferase family 39 protein, partial [Roseiflexaceae bacterium]